MPKLSSNKRLVIPFEFRKRLSWLEPISVAVCYDINLDMILLKKEDDSFHEFVITFNKLDSKGRISMSEDCVKLLKATFDDYFVVFMKENTIYIKKV